MSLDFYSYKEWIKQHDLDPRDYGDCEKCSGSGWSFNHKCTLCNGTGERLYLLYVQTLNEDREKVDRAKKEKLIK